MLVRGGWSRSWRSLAAELVVPYAIRRGAPRMTLGIAVPAVTVLILPLFGSFYFDNQPNMLDSS